MTPSLSDALVVPVEKVNEKIGDIRAGAELAYAERLIASGITKRDDIAPWGSEIELVTKEIRRIEKVRDFFLEPIKEAKAAIEAARKRQSAMFDGPISILQSIKDKLAGPLGDFMLKCKTEDEAKARVEQEAAAQAASDAAKKDGNEFMESVAADEVLAEPLKKPLTKVTTPTGSTSMRFIPRVRIVDAKIVPRNYCKPDEDKLLADYKSGLITEVPGVEFYQISATWVR
jgi:hypothetical protein